MSELERLHKEKIARIEKFKHRMIGKSHMTTLSQNEGDL